VKQIQIFEDHATFISPAIHTDMHKHHALEVIVSIKGEIQIAVLKVKYKSQTLLEIPSLRRPQ